MIALAIPTWHRLEFTQECLETLTKYTNFDLVSKVIVYDNNSGSKMLELLDSFNYNYVISNFNTAWAGMNSLFNTVKNDKSIKYIGKVDNDVSFTQNWIESIFSEFEGRDSCGSIRYGYSGSDGIVSPIQINGGFHGGLKIFRKSCYRIIPNTYRYCGSDNVSQFIRKSGKTTDSMEVGVSMLTKKYPELSRLYRSKKWQRK
jgi:GT2 family glycosyltransferase